MNEHVPCNYKEKIGEFSAKIELIIAGKTEVLNKIDCLEKKLTDPDKGLFSRVKENTLFRKSVKKWLYVIGSGLIGLILHTILEKLANG